MELTLTRLENGPRTIGKLFLGAKLLFDTLEQRDREVRKSPPSAWKVEGDTSLPSGRYKLAKSVCVGLGMYSFSILNVPEFPNAKITLGDAYMEPGEGHIAPFNGMIRSKGCYRDFCSKVMPLLLNEGVWITIERAYDIPTEAV